MKKNITIIFLLMITTLSYSLPSINSLLKQMEENMELEGDGTAKVKITQSRVDQGEKQIESVYYRRDSDDSFLIVMTAPEIEKGNGYLRVGDNFWMYRRNTRTFQHVNRDESIAGTDSNGEDFENRKMTEMYKGVLDENGIESIKEGKLGKISCYVVDLINKVDDVAYPKKRMWLRKGVVLPLKEQNFTLNGKLMQTNYFTKYTKINGKYMWVKGIFVDEFEKGNKSVVEIEEVSIQTLGNEIFTKAYLENLSK